MSKTILFWFRQDLRIIDNPGFHEALKNGQVMPVYIFDKNQDDFKMGKTSRWWLHESLQTLNKKLGDKLNLYRGKSLDVLTELVKSNDVSAVFWNMCFDPWRDQIDKDVASFLEKKKIDYKSFNGTLLWEPETILKGDGTPYKVFTPFYRKGCLSAEKPRKPEMNCPKMALIKNSKSLNVSDLDLLSDFDSKPQFGKYWTVGEDGAQKRLKDFLDNGLKGYKEGRNFPAKQNVSRLSPHIHFGEISIHQIWYDIQARKGKAPGDDIDHFLSELGWREFSHYLLHHQPDLPRENMQKKFDNFPWKDDEDLLKAWQNGQTGYPIVDAGMRELMETGYMHNRSRMIVGSFLVKNLLMHWHHGEDWFWKFLADADIASNSASWQWVAGSGSDAAPYFRVFNPILQGEKFDKDGSYTKRFVPELKDVPSQYLFKLWEAPESVLKRAGVTLGKTYPKPIVMLDSSRKRALDAFATISKKK